MADPHSGRRFYIDWDHLTLLCEICTRRLPMVAGEATKINRGIVPFNQQELRDLTSIRRMHARMERGDMRITRNELSLLQDVGNWLIRLHAQNKNQETDKSIHLEPKWRSNSLPADAYDSVRQQIHAGALDQN